MAKTFIYAWLLGAGVAKTGQILKVNMKEAQEARTRFEMSIDGLYNLKNTLVPYIADQDTSLGMMDVEFQYPTHTKPWQGYYRMVKLV